MYDKKLYKKVIYFAIPIIIMVLIIKFFFNYSFGENVNVPKNGIAYLIFIDRILKNIPEYDYIEEPRYYISNASSFNDEYQCVKFKSSTKIEEIKALLVEYISSKQYMPVEKNLDGKNDMYFENRKLKKRIHANFSVDSLETLVYLFLRDID